MQWWILRKDLWKLPVKEQIKEVEKIRKYMPPARSLKADLVKIFKTNGPLE